MAAAEPSQRNEIGVSAPGIIDANESDIAGPANATTTPATASRINARVLGAIVLVIVIIAAAVYYVRRPRYQPSEGDLNSIADATFGPNGTIAVRTAARGIHLFDISSGTPIRHIPLYVYARSRSWSPDLGKFVLLVRPIQVYDCSGSGTPPFRELLTKATNVWDARLDPTGRLVATADDQPAVEIWDATSGQLLRSLRAHTAPVWSVEFSADGRLLASGSQDNTVRVWDVHLGKAIHTFTGHVAKIAALRFSRDARWLLSIADDKTARIWSLANPVASVGEFFRSANSSDQLTSGAFSPDGRMIALSGSPDGFAEPKKKDGAIWLMDRRSRQIVWEHRTTAGVGSVEFNPTGNLLLVVSGGSADVWDVLSRKVVAHYPPLAWPPGQVQ